MFAKRYQKLTPYTPGEQPRNRKYIKLNTNENPYPPSPSVAEFLHSMDITQLRLYPDPSSLRLREMIGEYNQVSLIIFLSVTALMKFFLSVSTHFLTVTKVRFFSLNIRTVFIRYTAVIMTFPSSVYPCKMIFLSPLIPFKRERVHRDYFPKP